MKYHNCTLQNNQGYHEEEPQNNNNHKKPGRQKKAKSSLFDIKMIAKLERTQNDAQPNMEKCRTSQWER